MGPFELRGTRHRCGRHIHGNAGTSIGSNAPFVATIDRFNLNFVVHGIHGSFGLRPRQGTAGAVATKRTGSIGVAKVHMQDIGRAQLHHQHPIRPYAMFAVTNAFDFSGVPVRRQNTILASIHKDKVIARAFPFFILETHSTKVG